MKRSEINSIISESIDFFNRVNFKLPKWGYYNLNDWLKIDNDISEITDLGLGWDITDFGLGEFEKYGLILFTIRNGQLDSSKYAKTYCEKIMVCRKDQVTPFHYHKSKTEDIINRFGGKLGMDLYMSDENGEKSEKEFSISIDGIQQYLSADSTIFLEPGQSITFDPYLTHQFYATEDDVIVGEVSSVNDDHSDNFFHPNIGRFPQIEEDVNPTYLLVNDYKKFLNAE